MAKVIWSDPALNDLDQIFRYLAKASQSVELAERICDELMECAKERLEKLPASGSLVEEGRDYGAREIYKHAYRIIYIQRGEACYIVRCIHSSRDLARELNPADWPQIAWKSEDN